MSSFITKPINDNSGHFVSCIALFFILHGSKLLEVKNRFYIKYRQFLNTFSHINNIHIMCGSFLGHHICMFDNDLMLWLLGIVRPK